MLLAEDLSVRFGGLKAVEKDALNMKKAAKKVDALDGLKATANLATVAQHSSGLPRNGKPGVLGRVGNQ